ncbi:MAG: hypothetical protein U9O87_01170 [Verrucomicrobiota bacterium]|nr:hypothetical protein [Verrucomicrobiota bacterium]
MEMILGRNAMFASCNEKDWIIAIIRGLHIFAMRIVSTNDML